MSRTIVAGLLVVSAFTTTPAARAQATGATAASTYEVQIDGETFEVEANRAVKLESKEKPGVTYQVAVRVAPIQRIRLDEIEFEYDLPAKAETAGSRGNRSVRLSHELGFSILLRDLGTVLDAKAQQETLATLVASVTEALRQQGATSIDVSEPHEREFGGSSGRGITLRYRDARDFGHVYLLYVLSGRTFAASCVVEYLESDGEDVLPLIKKTLDSVRAIASRR